MPFYRNLTDEIKFGWQPMPNMWRRLPKWDLANFITDADRALAATLTEKEWPFDARYQSNQGATAHCTGFADLNFANCNPVVDAWPNQAGHDLYYEIVAAAGRPRTEDGATSEEAARAMVKRGRIQGFAWASNIEDIFVWLLTKGPICTGLVWTLAMCEPDSNGLMHATGRDEGGHETCWNYCNRNTGLLGVLNSWGNAWGKGGRAYLTADDMVKALDRYGDAWMAVELPLPAPDPTPTPVPVPSGRLTDLQIAQLVVSNGFQNPAIAVAVALAESGGDTNARNTAGNSPPSTDRGLFQINSYWHREVSDACAYNADCCTKAAYRISNGGRNWTPWTTYNVGAHKKYLARAQAAVAAVVNPPAPPVPQPGADVAAAIRADLADHPTIEVNVGTGLVKESVRRALGPARSSQWGVSVGGITYAYQWFDKGILYCDERDSDHIWML